MGQINESDRGEGLASILCRIVSDPDKTRTLHGILGPFCHQCRNLLNCLKLSLYLTQRDAQGPGAGSWTEIERKYQAVEQLYDRLQSICRPMPLSPVNLSLSLLMEERRGTWIGHFAARDRSLELIPPKREDVGQYDPQWLGQALDQFIEWRAASGRASEGARLRWWTERGHFRVEWTEAASGSGAIVDPDPECSESLALPLLGRVIAAHGGTLTIREPSGRHLRMSWPQVARPPQ